MQMTLCLTDVNTPFNVGQGLLTPISNYFTQPNQTVYSNLILSSTVQVTYSNFNSYILITYDNAKLSLINTYNVYC